MKFSVVSVLWMGFCILESISTKFRSCSFLEKKLIDFNREKILNSLEGFHLMQMRLTYNAKSLSELAISSRTLGTTNRNVEVLAVVLSANNPGQDARMKNRINSTWATGVLIAKYVDDARRLTAKCAVHRVMTVFQDGATSALNEIPTLMNRQSYQSTLSTERVPSNFMLSAEVVPSNVVHWIQEKLIGAFPNFKSIIDIIAVSGKDVRESEIFCIVKFTVEAKTYCTAAVVLHGNEDAIVEFSMGFNISTPVERFVEDEVNGLTLPLAFVQWISPLKTANIEELELTVKDHLMLNTLPSADSPPLTLENMEYGMIASHPKSSAALHFVRYCWNGGSVLGDSYIYAVIMYIIGNYGESKPIVRTLVVLNDEWETRFEADRFYFKFVAWAEISSRSTNTSSKAVSEYNRSIVSAFQINVIEGEEMPTFVEHIYQAIIETRQFTELTNYEDKILQIEICKVYLTKLRANGAFKYCALIFDNQIENPPVSAMFSKSLEVLINTSLMNFCFYDHTTELAWHKSLPKSWIEETPGAEMEKVKLKTHEALLEALEDAYGAGVHNYYCSDVAYAMRVNENHIGALYITGKLTSTSSYTKYLAAEMDREVTTVSPMYKTLDMAQDFAALQH